MTALTSESRWRAAHGGAALRLDISAAAITCVYIIFIAHPLPGRSLAAGGLRHPARPSTAEQRLGWSRISRPLP